MTTTKRQSPPVMTAPPFKVSLPSGPRKRPRQARSIALVDALHKAALEILEERGRDALTPVLLSERSGVATSSIYEYFPTLDSLVTDVFNNLREDTQRALLQRVRELPSNATLFDGLLLLTNAIVKLRQRLLRYDPELHVRYTQLDELMRIDVVDSPRHAGDTVTGLLMSRFAGEVSTASREKSIFLAFHVLQAALRAMAIERPEYLADDDTAHILAKLLIGILGSQS